MKQIEKFTMCVCALALVSALTVTAAPAFAGGKIVPEDRLSQVRYDWLKANGSGATNKSGLSAKERRRLAWRIARHGSGSYICSPSGFGKKSRCYSR